MKGCLGFDLKKAGDELGDTRLLAECSIGLVEGGSFM